MLNGFSFFVIDLHLTGNAIFSRKLFVNYQISHFSKGNFKKNWTLHYVTEYVLGSHCLSMRLQIV